MPSFVSVFINLPIKKILEGNSLPVRDFLICYIFLQFLSASSWCPTKWTAKNINLHVVRSIFCCDKIKMKMTSMRHKLQFNLRSNKSTCFVPFYWRQLEKYSVNNVQYAVGRFHITPQYRAGASGRSTLKSHF